MAMLDDSNGKSLMTITQVKWLLNLLVIAVSLVSLGVSAVAQNHAAIPQKIDQYMQTLANLDRFSGAILVAKNGRVIRSRGYKFANVEWEALNGPDTKFRIGSITKSFTAMAIMMLQERGRLHVSDPICRYLTSCPAAWQPITIHQLLTHTSGIPDYLDFPDFERTETLSTTPEGLIDRFRDKPLQFTPGEKFSYSNSGYVLLAVIVERVSGQSYEEFLRSNIFNVLRMANTGYDNNTKILPRRAAGYAKNGTILENAAYIDPSVAYAAGGLYSTVQDLLIWDEALYTEKLVSRKSLGEIFTPYKDVVGYGWAIGTLFNRKVEHHNGEINGFVSNIARFPDSHVLILVLSNRDGIQVDNITRDLAAIVFGETYQLPKERKIIKLDPNLYGKYEGTYQITADIKLTIGREGDHLFAELSGSEGGKFEVFPESETKFFSDSPPAELLFSAEQNGKMSDVLVNGEYKGKRVP